ncbi:hypothetical protein [Streptomyces sp. NPDC048106]|uniref:hypothetical protein n=1 Tax=Streptomyces sp. NPDC048106 TaxID=3155750 RepID=UPI0034511508
MGTWWSERLGKEIVSLWAAGLILGVPVWIFIEILWHPDSVLGDGGLAAFGLLIILFVVALFTWTGIMIVRDAINESRATTDPARRSRLTLRVLAAGTAGWVALRAILVLGHHVPPTAGLLSAIPLAASYPLAFLILGTRADLHRRVTRTVLPASLALVILLRFI